MKFIVKKDKLKQALAKLNKAITVKASLPVLQNILVEYEEGLLKLTASDLDKTIVTFVEGKIEEGESATFPAKLFFNLINNIKEEILTGQIKKNKIKISTENSNTILNGTESSDFPEIKLDLKDNPLKVNTKVLKDVVNNVAYSAAVDDTRPEFTGILIERDDNNINFVATDVYRLSKQNITVDNSEEIKRTIIPSRNLLEFSKLFEEEEINIDIQEEENRFIVYTKNTICISRLIDADYPTYQAIVPEFKDLSRFTVAKKEFLEGLKTATLFSIEKNAIRINCIVEENLIELVSQSPALGENKTEIEVNFIEGSESESLAINSKHLIEYLSHVREENLILAYTKQDDEGGKTMLKEKEEDLNYYLMVNLIPYWE